MKIDGRAIADKILANLTGIGVTPTLAVIQVGDDEASTTYINQKKKAAEKIGARVIHTQFPHVVSKEEIINTIKQYNNDISVHGVILQRPLPQVALYRYIDLKKDVDGFLPNSLYTPPVAAAVMRILEETQRLTGPGPVKKQDEAPSVVVIGRGETAGKPIADTLQKNGWAVQVIHSQTPNSTPIIKNHRIIISCVGKERVVTLDMVTPQTILIGVGLWRDSRGKLRGDYDEDEIKDTVAYYTPTPGGVGPVNVASLMQNLVKATIASL